MRPEPFDHLLVPADPDAIELERRKARQLKLTPWWKNRLGEGKCAYCGHRFSPGALTMDHVTPLVRGGRTTRGNCVPACRACNRMKSNLPAEEWKAYLDRLQNGR